MLCSILVCMLLVFSRYVKCDNNVTNSSFVMLQKLYSDTINAHQTFIHSWDDVVKMMNREGISNNIKNSGGRFLQVKLQGPVNVENIREGLYDTQSKRDPPAARVYIDEKENMKKLYDDAKEYNMFRDDSDWDSFQINMHKLYRNIH